MKDMQEDLKDIQEDTKDVREDIRSVQDSIIRIQEDVAGLQDKVDDAFEVVIPQISANIMNTIDMQHTALKENVIGGVRGLIENFNQMRSQMTTPRDSERMAIERKLTLESQENLKEEVLIAIKESKVDAIALNNLNQSLSQLESQTVNLKAEVVKIQQQLQKVEDGKETDSSAWMRVEGNMNAKNESFVMRLDGMSQQIESISSQLSRIEEFSKHVSNFEETKSLVTTTIAESLSEVKNVLEVKVARDNEGELSRGMVTEGLKTNTDTLLNELRNVQDDVSDIAADFSAARNALREGLERFKAQRDSNQEAVVESLAAVSRRFTEENEKVMGLSEVLQRIELNQASLKDTVESLGKAVAGASSARPEEVKQIEEISKAISSLKEKDGERYSSLMNHVNALELQLADVKTNSSLERRELQENFTSGLVMLNQKHAEAMEAFKQNLKRDDVRKEQELSVQNTTTSTLQLLMEAHENGKANAVSKSDLETAMMTMKQAIETAGVVAVREEIESRFKALEAQQQDLKSVLMEQTHQIKEEVDVKVASHLSTIKTQLLEALKEERIVSQKRQHELVEQSLREITGELQSDLRLLDASVKVYMETRVTTKRVEQNEPPLELFEGPEDRRRGQEVSH